MSLFKWASDLAVPSDEHSFPYAIAETRPNLRDGSPHSQGTCRGRGLSRASSVFVAPGFAAFCADSPGPLRGEPGIFAWRLANRRSAETLLGGTPLVLKGGAAFR
jgi:hypothetical protein